MPSFGSFALTAALLTSYVAAAPAESVAARSVFSVHQVPNSKWNTFKASGPAAMAKTYAKYSKHGATMPDDVKAAVVAAAAQSGSVTTNPEDAYDSEYLCPVSIGTPAKSLSLDFDTGSADLWVFSSEQPTSQSSGHTIYTPSASSTEKKLSGSTWSISYGDGSGASGDVYVDKVVVGPVTATSQAVEAATSVSSTFVSDTASDGLLGLAFSSINTVSPTKQKTFFDTVKSTLASPLFCANLKHQAAGTYDFGYIDSSKYTGSISYSNVNTANGFWEITGSGYAVGTGAFASTSIDAIVDTGTTLLYLPTAVVTAYYKKVTGSSYNTAAGGYIFPCSATLPSFTFGVGSYRGVIPGSYMNYAPYSGSSCFGGIQRNTGIGFSIFGDILIKAQYVVFNGASTPQVGFAAKATS